MTLGHLLDEALPRLTNPTAAVFDYWRAELGDVQLAKISPELIAHASRSPARCRLSRAPPQDALTASANSRPSSIR